MKKASRGSKSANVKIILSLIVAFVLWIYVMGDQDPINNQRYSNIDIQLRNESILEERDLVLVGLLDTSVDITVEGRTSVLYNLAWRSIRAYVDLGEITDKGSFDLPVEILGIPESVDLSNVNPATVTVEIDRKIQQNREVDIRFSGELTQGLQLTDYTSNTGTVVVEGGENLLATVNRIGGTIDLSGKVEGFSEVVTLKAYDAEGVEVEGVSLEPEEVTVTVAIGNNYALPVEVVVSGEPEEGYAIKEIQVSPAQVSVVSQGPAALTKIETEPINIEGINGDAEISVALIFPAGIRSASGTETVQVNITLEPIETREFSLSTFEYRNRPEALQVATSQEDVNVVVRLSGAASIIENLSQSQIQLYVDLSEAEAGQNQVSLQMESIENIELLSLEPDQMLVTLEEGQ